MTRDDITRMAREAGFVGFDGENRCLREFAALVVAAERERIIKANAPEIERCNAYIKELEESMPPKILRVIRARGNT
jgi:hypothetical protein